MSSRAKGWRCKRSDIDADKVIDVLDRLVRERGSYPQFVRCDNGPEMTRRRCGTGVGSPGPGRRSSNRAAPWENAFVESFNGRVRDELLSGEVFSCLAEAKVMMEYFRDDYSRRRRHRAYNMMTPTAFKTGVGDRPPGRARQR